MPLPDPFEQGGAAFRGKRVVTDENIHPFFFQNLSRLVLRGDLKKQKIVAGELLLSRLFPLFFGVSVKNSYGADEERSRILHGTPPGKVTIFKKNKGKAGKSQKSFPGEAMGKGFSG